ncbi:MAG: dTMP kinase [Treponema sp.]|nr:dTMP kinase [Treponema sp.]
MVLHNFIVFEGIDGAGTSTQLKRLSERADSDRFFFTAEPTDLPTGRFLRSMLKGEVVLDPRTASYLFAADRIEHLWGKDAGGNATGIEPIAQSGKIVVSDRYLFSSLAYQSIDCGMELPLSLNKPFPLPELLFFFDLDPKTALSRVDSRGSREIYEKEDFLCRVRDAYHKVFNLYKDSGMKIITLDATQTADEVETLIAAEINALYTA